jgi:DNA-binding CsgD family transcriptional regulator
MSLSLKDTNSPDCVILASYGLTPREMEIAGWMARGKTNSEIAIILGSAVRTVEKHMERILEKMNVENRVAATAIVASSGRFPAINGYRLGRNRRRKSPSRIPTA